MIRFEEAEGRANPRPKAEFISDWRTGLGRTIGSLLHSSRLYDTTTRVARLPGHFRKDLKMTKNTLSKLALSLTVAGIMGISQVVAAEVAAPMDSTAKVAAPMDSTGKAMPKKKTHKKKKPAPAATTAPADSTAPVVK
jgi:hypothetical protein